MPLDLKDMKIGNLIYLLVEDCIDRRRGPETDLTARIADVVDELNSRQEEKEKT